MERENNNIGYKAMESDMTCRKYQFEVGKSYEIEKDSKLEIYNNGFHFCFDAVGCLDCYDNFDGNKRFFKIQYDEVIIDALGFSGELGCTNKITILEEIDILDYIRENKDTVDWELIYRNQKLSEDFIREHLDYIDWTTTSE